MTLRAAFALMVVLTCFLMPTAIAVAQPPAPTVLAQAKFELSNQPSELDIVQRVVDFPPDAVLARHTHGGPQYVTVIEGELTLNLGGKDTVYKVGDTWIEPQGEPHSARNAGTAKARIVASALLPKGAAYSTALEPAAQIAPMLVSENKFEAKNVPADLDVIQRVVDFPPGGVIAPHYHPGSQYLTLIEGELTLNLGGKATTYQPGQGWIELARDPHSAETSKTAKTRLVSVALLPRGAALSVSVDQAAGQTMPTAMPTTGSVALMTQVALIGVGSVVFGLGLALRRRSHPHR